MEIETLRIRNYRQGDIPTLVHIQQLAAEADGTETMSAADFEDWLAQPELEAHYNVFLLTDDDDDLNNWGQGGTLDGLEGEVIGYTVLQLRQSQHAYHFRCEGAVLPQHRHRGAGQALLICALNHARIHASEFEFEAQQRGHPIYFEALLPANDPASKGLAAKCELQPVHEPALKGVRLYRGEL
jgi:GNAT superfamily N-acetyltransferase